MTFSIKIEVLRILHLLAVGLHTCTAVARSLCVSWAFLLISRQEVIISVDDATNAKLGLTSCHC